MTKPNKEKEAILTVDYLRECLEYFPDTGKFTWKTRPIEHFKNERDMKIWNTRYAGKEALTALSHGYKNGSISRGGKKFAVKAHRVGWALVHGEWPDEQIDHIDGVKTDNRLDKLRPASNKINGRNQPMSSKNTSGVVGVARYNRKSGCWVAHINDNNGKGIKLTNPDTGLQYFPDKIDAIYARHWAERDLGYHENHGRSS
jgi:hypothetical protein